MSRPSTLLLLTVLGTSTALQAPFSSVRKTAPLLQRSAQPSTLAPAFAAAAVALAPALPVLADEGSGFAATSYYTTLAVYVLSFPGIYSLVKRSVKSKVVRKTYEVAGPAAAGGRPTREVAGDIVAFFQANNYKITDAAETIVFEGTQAPVFSRAAFLTFCTFIALISLSLVLTIFEQQAFGGGLGNIWYASTLISPLAGKFYLDNAERTEQITVKIITEDDEMSSDIVVQGDEEEVERCASPPPTEPLEAPVRCPAAALTHACVRVCSAHSFQKTLDMREKGMIYVKGILES